MLEYIKQFLTYSTVKIVKIRDWRLSLLHYLFMFGIVCYIGGWTIAFEKRYLLLDPPVGSVRLSLQQGVNVTYPEHLVYCNTTVHQNVSIYPNYPCLYIDESFVLYPIVEQSAMFATTRLRIEEQESNCSLPRDPTCTYVTLSNDTYYTGDIENFTLVIDHTMYAPQLGLQYNAKQLPGELLDVKGTKMDPQYPSVIGQAGQSDLLKLSELMSAAGIDTLDSPSKATPGTSLRYDGLLLLVFIEYSNTFSWNLYNTKYIYTVRVIEDTKFKAEEPIFTKNITNRLIWVRHGIRVIFLQGGEIGKFDFQVMLLTFVSGVGLLAVATVVVDAIAIYLIPEKIVYKSHKYELTDEYTPLLGQHRHSHVLNTSTSYT